MMNIDGTGMHDQASLLRLDYHTALRKVNDRKTLDQKIW